MWRAFTWYLEDPASSLCSSYFQPDEQPYNTATVKWLSYSQFWPKKPTKQNQPQNILELMFLGIFQLKTFRKVLVQATKSWKRNLSVKQVQQVNHSALTVTLIQHQWNQLKRSTHHQFLQQLNQILFPLFTFTLLKSFLVTYSFRNQLSIGVFFTGIKFHSIKVYRSIGHIPEKLKIII